jgi:acyl-CoA thioester hydrolase
MIYHTDIQVRFNDTDAFGHLNNTAFALYAEQARVEFFREIGTRGSIILAHIALDFRKQVRYGDKVHVTTQIERIGNSSISLWQLVYANAELAAEVSSVVVFFDYQAQTPKTIPDEIRQKLQPYLKQ